MKRIRTHRFASGVYRVSQQDVAGFTRVPHEPLELWISDSATPHRELLLWIHEGLHAEFPYMSEAKVEAAEKHIGGFLWRLGYRQKRGTR